MLRQPTTQVMVVGGGGTAGRAYVAAFRAAGHNVTATVRPGANASDLKALGAKVVEVDLHDAAAARSAVGDAGLVVIALMGRGPQPAADEQLITNNVLSAVEANASVGGGVRHVVYTSVLRADVPSGVAHFDVKAELEAAVRRVAPAHTILRPCTFMDGLTAPWFRASIDEHSTLMSPIAKGALISYVAARDVAALAVRAWTDPRLVDRTIDLGGPEAVTYERVLGLLSSMTGKEVQYRQVPIADVEARMGPDIAAMIRMFNTRGFAIDMTGAASALGLRLTTVEELLHAAYAARTTAGDQ